MPENQTPAPKPKTIAIDLSQLPENVTAEQIVKALAALDQRKTHTYAYNKNRRVAMKHLATKYAKDYTELLEKAKTGAIE